MKIFFLSLFLFISSGISAQNKKPLDHSVYDGWKSVGERFISNDGKYIVYAINPQEGDGELIIQNAAGLEKKTIARGYNAVITEDSRYVVFKIKPKFQETRQAKIKKKKADDMTKDSIGIVELGKDEVVRFARVKGFKTPEKGFGYVAYHMEKALSDSTKRTKKAPVVDSAKANIDMLVKLADSIIRKSIESVNAQNLTREEMIGAANKAVKEIIKKSKDELYTTEDVTKDADGDDAPGGGVTTEGTDLIVRRLSDGKEKTFKLVSDYAFDKKGTRLVLKTTRAAKDSNSVAFVLLYNLQSEKTDTVMRNLNDGKNFSFDEEGTQLAFVAERDSSTKALQKFYKLWYYTAGQDSAKLVAEKNTVGMQIGFTISENATIRFSKDGKKLFFGTAPITAAKDTTLVDFELARLDVWHYNDDYLQPMQLRNLTNEQRRSYLAVMKPGDDKIIQLGTDDAENITIVDEGNADWVLAQSNKGNRVSMQWEGRTRSTAYAISTVDGKRRMIKSNALGNFSASPAGKYVYWYEPDNKNYFAWNAATGVTKNISDKIKEPLYDVENDVPDYPSPAGITGWTANDQYMLINDVYDIWQVDPSNAEQPKNITKGWGKIANTELTYIRFDREKRFIEADETIILRAFNKGSKYANFYSKKINEVADPKFISGGPYSYPSVLKAKDADVYLYQMANASESELFAGKLDSSAKLTNIAAQQKDYNWLTAELVNWKMFDGKWSQGILYKPENFDPKKKYPVIFYFYERDADGLYNYRGPAPSASTVNVPYFVSNEYLIFDPNIYYKDGEPGNSAYNSVVSAAKHLSKMPWVDSTRMALQGQSWGGYQIAYLVTKTNIFRAAWAGAPVSNMTSAYGGIRWGTGLNRQFQYEKTQSRIGATLWQRPDLYLKNSPLFAADKVTTPLVMMHNDADGAVPWYQGIEFFTALRRLNKKVWLLQYNGEDHNLVERKNRKDLSVRLGQFFDYYLKDAKPARWIKEGLPATEKGRDWGLGIE